MKLLLLMCGFAFAGKSTVAKKIADQTGACIISLDEINAERSLRGGEGIPDSEWEKTHQMALERLTQAISKGEQTIIVDDTNCFRWLRNNYRDAASPHGYRTMVILLDLPAEVVLQRAVENQTRNHVLPHILKELIYKFEYPDENEEETVPYNGNQPFVEWMNELTARCKAQNEET